MQSMLATRKYIKNWDTCLIIHASNCAIQKRVTLFMKESLPKVALSG